MFFNSFFTFVDSIFFAFTQEVPFFCVRHHLVEALNNIPGITEKMPQSRNKALFVMYIIISWSYPTKFSITQEPLKILEICDKSIFLTLQGIHMPKTT